MALRKQETDFQVGDECMYKEDGGIQRCRVVSRELEDGMLRLELEVLENINPPFHAAIVRIAQVGEVFTASKPVTGLAWHGIWHIEEV